MEGSHQEYPALLRSLSPGQALTVLEDRIQVVGKVNTDVADWLSERRRVEDAYAQGLKKLASRRPQNVELLGVFRTPWQTIVSSVESLANSHSTLATRIQTDVEVPLREFQTKNREMKAITSIQGNIASIAREVDNAHRKASKLNVARSNANKVANATSDVEAANLQWDTQAPYAFETLQALDESRVSHLRDVLTQLETHEVDQVERSRVTAEACLNALLNIDTSEEISTFVARTSAGISSAPAPARESRGSDSAAAELPALRSTPSRPSAPRPEDGANDRPSPFASSLRSGSGGGSMAPPPPKKSGFGGLRRLGTVLSRPGKDTKGMERMDRPPSPDKEKRSRPSRNPLRRGPSSRQDMQTIPDDAPEMPKYSIPASPPQLDQPSFSRSTNKSPDRPRTPTNVRRSNTEVNGDSIQQAPQRISSMPVTNGLQTTREPVQLSDPPGGSTNVPDARRDAEGYNVPSSAVDEITRAQQEAAAAGDSEQPGFKLDIKSEPIAEEDPNAQSAFSSVANTLRVQAQQAAAPRKSNTNRGRRDVRNTVFVPSGQSMESAGLAGLAGIRTPGEVGGGSPPAMPSLNVQNSPIPSAEPTRGTDAQSIRSAHSMGGITHPTITHPNMNQPGLNASIVETVSATFSQSQVTKAVVIGELALQHNAGEATLSSGTETVRLENFPVLEKVAPNPTFIAQKSTASGEYSVNLSHIGRPTVAFKYQVHIDETNLAAHAPISLTPNWRIESTQASMILAYAFNPAFVSPATRSVSLKNVTVAVTVENAKALSCQSKPVGIFAKDKSLIYWKLGDITLDAYAEMPQKLLARFTTDGEAKPGSVEVKWEIGGEAAVGLGSGLGLSSTGMGTGKEEGGGGGGGGGGSDPFADDSVERTVSASTTTARWQEVPVTRRIISGKYIAN